MTLEITRNNASEEHGNVDGYYYMPNMRRKWKEEKARMKTKPELVFPKVTRRTNICVVGRVQFLLPALALAQMDVPLNSRRY